jgi:hypothetical protein
MQFELMLDFSGIEVPYKNLGDLSGEGILCTGDMSSISGYFDG